MKIKSIRIDIEIVERASLRDPDRLFVRRLIVDELDRLHARLLGVEL